MDTHQLRHRSSTFANFGPLFAINTVLTNHFPSRSTLSRLTQFYWICKHVQRHRAPQGSDLAAATRANRRVQAPSSRQASTGLALQICADTFSSQSQSSGLSRHASCPTCARVQAHAKIALYTVHQNSALGTYHVHHSNTYLLTGSHTCEPTSSLCRPTPRRRKGTTCQPPPPPPPPSHKPH